MKNEPGERRHIGLKVVLDTNVYVSIFNFPDSLLSEIWFHALKHHYELVTTQPLCP
jgi:predicted nucleic acid-binding protein